MKRKLLSILIVLLFTIPSYAAHLTGGEMYYTYVKDSSGYHIYIVTVKLFKDASINVALDDPITVAVYDKGTNAFIRSVPVFHSGVKTMTATPGPCIVNPPLVSYDVALYTFRLALPPSIFGYVLTWARCCRVANITNLTAPSANYGVTYTAEIPGTFSEPTGPVNSSARFLGIDTVIICSGYDFNYNFGATDPNGDILTYEFCNGYSNSGINVPNPPPPPPFNMLSYNFPYSGASPLGSGVTINPNTGMISGTAPAAGIYVVTVCVKEWRNGELIATQRKDLQIKIADCDIATVTLEPNGYINCNNYSVSFNNLTPSSLINNYFWDFGDASTLGDTSRAVGPSYIYPDTGIYVVKVVANRNQPCSDSITAQVRVYPGFFPAFDHVGMCMNVPVQFNDLTTATYGVIDLWKYDFGVTSISGDTSRLQTPQYTYTATGNYTAQFTVGTSKGCRATIAQIVNIIDKPPITLAFRDTLICNDTIQLNASATGAVSWTPAYNILNSTSITPSVYPQSTTWYTVEFNDNGCINKDSIQVRVTNTVSLVASNDTTICANDPVQLFANTDGFQYAWRPDPTLSNTSILNPVVNPIAPITTYQVAARIGNCVATEDVVITVVPRTLVNAGLDTIICYNSIAQLNAQTNGTSFTWSSPSSLSDATILNPIATPVGTTKYVLTAIDNTSGCPKPSYDTVTVTVLSKVIAFAGNDTSIIATLPFQLKATGGSTYQWSPAANLDNPNIASPIATLDGNPEYVTYMVTAADQAGCTDTANITIRVYKTGPQIFVPTGFSPDGNGRNDVFRPVYVGMKSIDYFQVYNRWGAMIYSNNLNNGKGWDGTIKGIKQNTGAYIWMVKAVDVFGNVHFKKGTVVLVR